MPEEVKCITKVYDFLKHQNQKKGGGGEEFLCPFTLDEGRRQKKKIKEPVEDMVTDPSLSHSKECSDLSTRKAQTWHIFGKKMQNLSSSWGRFDFVTSFQVSQKKSEFESIACKAFSMKIKDTLFSDRDVLGSHFPFQNPD